ncbi:MAG: hypothetical protein K8T91_22585 [Planctomycetes bacterium]|nr:hypothetical protein [Planctomycetota bacterium]
MPLTVAAQAPTTADPLPVYPTIFGKEKLLVAARDEAIKLVRHLDKEIGEAEALVGPGKIKQLSETKIEALHEQIIFLERQGFQFEVWGELIGADIRQRVEVYRDRLTKLADLRTTDKAIVPKILNRLKRVDSDSQEALRRMPQVVQLLDRKQPEQAQLLFWRLTKEAEPRTIWYGRPNLPPRAPSAYSSLVVYRNKCSEAMRALWKAQALKACADAIATLSTDYGKLIQQADQVAAALSKASEVDLDGEKLSGPAAIEALGERWRQLDLATQQARGWGWLSARLGGGDTTSSLVVAQRSQCNHVAAALGRIIAADAARAKPEEAGELYRAYVARLTPLVLLVGDQTVLQPVRLSLGTLAARSPALLAEVGAYHNATDELLRWRERITVATVQNRMGQFPTIDQISQAVAQPVNKNIGPLLTNGPSSLVARHTHSVPVMLSRIAPLQSKQVTAFDLVSIGANKALAIGNFPQPARFYVKVTPAAAKSAITILMADLFSTDKLPPLTLEGRAALEGARQGDLMAAGGPIVKLGLVTWGEHLAKLSATQRGAVRLGPILSDAVLENELIMLVQIDASWMAGRYYFVNVPPPAEKPPAEK